MWIIAGVIVNAVNGFISLARLVYDICKDKKKESNRPDQG